jgi:hypothetical protein
VLDFLASKTEIDRGRSRRRQVAGTFPSTSRSAAPTRRVATRHLARAILWAGYVQGTEDDASGKVRVENPCAYGHSVNISVYVQIIEVTSGVASLYFPLTPGARGTVPSQRRAARLGAQQQKLPNRLGWQFIKTWFGRDCCWLQVWCGARADARRREPTEERKLPDVLLRSQRASDETATTPVTSFFFPVSAVRSPSPGLWTYVNGPMCCGGYYLIPGPRAVTLPGLVKMHPYYQRVIWVGGSNILYSLCKKYTRAL